MPTYAFEARDPTGRLIRGIELAADERELDRVLGARELLLVKARRGRRRAGRGASGRTLIDFCYHLATVIEAGIPLLDGLRDLQEGGSSPIADELEDIARKLESGSQLSEAMAGYPRVFPGLVRALVAAGEESGNLDRILRDLVRFLEWREELRRQIISAATYPSIVVLGVIGLAVLLTTVVLPTFLGLFVELGVELPFTTRALLATHTFLTSWGIHLLVGLVAAGISIWAYRRTPPGRLQIDGLILRTPVIGPLVAMIEMSRFAHNLGLLYASGIPIVRCLELIREIVQNRVIRGAIESAEERLGRGGTLTSSLEDRDFLPPMVVRMLRLGESSGRLDQSLEHVGSYYDREVPGVISALITFFNTAAVVFLGVVLAAVALGVFVPLYQMMGNLNG